MARAGSVVENPVIGDRIVFLQTSADTNGELLQFDHFKTGSTPVDAHIHPRQDERFIVVKGTMGVRLGKDEHILKEGQEISVPPGAAHTWWNAGDGELHQITEFRPALRFEEYAETLAAFGREERIYSGIKYVLQFAVLFTESPDNVYAGAVPVWLQKLLFPLLAPFGRMLGYKERYLRYRLPSPSSSSAAAQTTAVSDGAGAPQASPSPAAQRGG